MAGGEVGRTFYLVHLPAGRSQHTRQHGECMHDSLRLTGRSNHSLQEQEPQNDTWHKVVVVNFPDISDPHPDQLALPISMSIPHAFPTLNSFLQHASQQSVPSVTVIVCVAAQFRTLDQFANCSTKL